MMVMRTARSTRLLAALALAYVAGDRRSPFVPDTPQRRVSGDPSAVEGPDPNRPREHLEQFPLDTLQMVGTLADRRASFGLVQTADGLVYRVTVGDHMGQNYGRIVAITDSEIQLVEIISDGLGGFLERPAKIGLAD
jgi:type IV pilus assembly protein PilP